MKAIIKLFLLAVIVFGATVAHGAELYGYIIGPKGRPLKGADIEIKVSGKQAKTVKANGDGSYSISLSPGKYKVTITTGGRTTGPRDVNIRPGDNRRSFKID